MTDPDGESYEFQFTPLREGRPDEKWLITRIMNFNSRPSARGDPCGRHSKRAHLHFNSRPSARGDIIGHDGVIRTKLISIHAPPRGATGGAGATATYQRISIHAPPRGATSPKSSWYHPSHDFNSRPSARGDREWRDSNAAGDDFNSRPSARGDGKRYAISANLLFNPYKSAWLNNRATQFVEIILVIFHRIIA